MVMTPQGSLLSRYRALTKPSPIEGIPDLLIFRPVAFLLVQALKRFPITPNQVSFSAIAIGLLSGLSFALGTRPGFAAGGLLYALAAVFDCADGMLARLRGTGTALGRIVDGAVDYANSVAVMTGLAIGVSRAGLLEPGPAFALTALAGVSMVAHCLAVDHFRGLFAYHALGAKNSVRGEIEAREATLAAARAEGGHHLLRSVLKGYLAYSRIQSRLAPRPRKLDAGAYARFNTPALRGWQLLELSVHILVLAAAALLFRPGLFYLYAIVAANAWMLIMIPVQRWADRKVAAQSPGPWPAPDGQAVRDGLS